MSVRLTETERRVAELYSRGMKPRQIAEALGISVNTVYKALSKARKAAEVVEIQPLPELAQYYYVFNTKVHTYPVSQYSASAIVVSKAVVVYDVADAILKKLDEILSILKNSGQSRHVEKRAPSIEVPNNGHDGDGHLPEAFRKNMWISLLRSKRAI